MRNERTDAFLEVLVTKSDYCLAGGYGFAEDKGY